MDRDTAEELISHLISAAWVQGSNDDCSSPKRMKELRQKAIDALCQPEDHSQDGANGIEFEFYMAVNKEGRPIHSTINNLKECADGHARFINLEGYHVLKFRAAEIKEG